MKLRLRLSEESLAEVREIFEKSAWLGQGNPEATEHPVTRAKCRAIRKKAGLRPQWNELCDAKNMVPIFDRDGAQTEQDARVCIDQFEFPNIACEYPVTWVRAREVVELCEAIGKRICDAHEWEGASAGSVRQPEDEYAWGEQRTEMRYYHNERRELVWAYGKPKDHAKCATGSQKSRACTVISWEGCGSNTYPAGAFPDCVGPFGVYDLHGNAAEHMNLPLKPEQLASRGGSGETEMKGSWFIFSTYEAHLDDCRWRAPNWHASEIMHVDSHQNYHLGFRCCKDLSRGGPQPAPTPSERRPVTDKPTSIAPVHEPHSTAADKPTSIAPVHKPPRIAADKPTSTAPIHKPKRTGTDTAASDEAVTEPSKTETDKETPAAPVDGPDQTTKGEQ